MGLRVVPSSGGSAESGRSEGASSARSGRSVRVWLPLELFEALEECCRVQNVSKSTAIRRAVRLHCDVFNHPSAGGPYRDRSS
jgi:Ribbon-helix-helix protein, copG family